MDVASLAAHALDELESPIPLKDALKRIPDFRLDRRKRHQLHEILLIAVCSMITGGKGPTDFERFGKAKLPLLRKFLALENGIPSHDTFRYVLANMDPRRFNAALVEWLASVADVRDDFVAIDGKVLRRATTKEGRKPCIVSARSSRTKLVIGQVKADEKSNEITAIPDLIDLLYLKGAIVTIDAAGCQRRIVRKLVRRGAGYVLSLKGNLRRASRGVSQYSATSVQRPVRLVAVRWLMAAETLRPKAAVLLADRQDRVVQGQGQVGRAEERLHGRGNRLRHQQANDDDGDTVLHLVPSGRPEAGT